MKIKKLLNVVEKLRNPKYGCPWDKKQNFESIIPHTIEEVYEIAEEIYNKNYDNLSEELGDLLFQIVLLSQIAKEKNKFNFSDVVNSVTKKMISRHPHVFEGKKFINSKDFSIFWENSKNKKIEGLLKNIPKSFPPLTKANKIQKKVAAVGFEYHSDLDAVDKIIEEANELKIEIKNKNKKKIKEELGDLIFSTLDLSRKLNLDPGIILSKANNKFIKRWSKLEALIKSDKKSFKELDLDNFNKYWKIAKKK